MGKASRKKRQKEFQAESALKDKPLKSSETSPKWGLFNKPLVHFFLIAIVGFIVYSNAFNVPFHFDDTHSIVENYKVRDLSNFWPPSGSRWFGFLTFALNYKLHGLDITGFHIVNLIIHILNSILVYWLVVLTFRTPYFKVHSSSFIVHSKRLISREQSTMSYEPSILIALFSALLFVSHPIQTQAVTYIVQRFTSLATMFYLLSLVMYIKFRIYDTRYRIQDEKNRESSIVHHASKLKLHATRYTLYAVSLLSAILAMKTKEISFTLPFIIVLYEFCFFKSQNYELRTMSFKRFFYLLPFILTMLIIPLSMIGTDKPIGGAIGELRDITQETEEISRWSYLFTQFRVIVTYIRLLFLPINQNLDYDYPIYHSFFNSNVFPSSLFLLIIFAFGIYLFYSKRYTLSATRLMAFGILWFFITLSVESSIIPIFDVIFEHRVYLPSVGIFIAITTSVFILASKLKRKWPQIEKTVTVVLALIIIILSITTYQRNTVWEDEVSLWEDVVKKSPAKARGYFSLGVCYSTQGWVDKAIQIYQTALMLNPYFPQAHNAIGAAYSNKGLFDKAIEHYQIALRLNPNDSEAHYNLGIAYNSKGLTDKAIEHYQIALRLNPYFPQAHNAIGAAYAAYSNKGLFDKAIEHYQIALRLKPDYAEAHFNLGLIYLRKGSIDKARKELEMALEINPNDYQARQFLNYISNLNKIRSH